jgi:hypothetical protein
MLWQLTPFFFLIAGSSEALLLGWARSEIREAGEQPMLEFGLGFRRVMT